METVIGKKQLCSVELKYFKALQGIGGKKLFERYRLAESNIIHKYIDAGYQDFLGYPVINEDLITFYGKTYSETPQLLSALHGDDLVKYMDIIEKTLLHYNNKIDFLKTAGKNDEAAFLTDAIKFIDDRFVYCYDDRIVLGVWGMQLRDNTRADVWEYCTNHIVKTVTTPIDTPSSVLPFTITYNAGDNGTLNGNSAVTKQPDEFLSADDIPQVEPGEGYEFVGWDENPNGHKVTGDKEFTAQYRQKPPVVPPKLPWYHRWWNWFRLLFIGRNWLKWLLWLLLLLLLLWLFSRLFRGCNESHIDGIPAIGDNDSSWIRDDPRVRDGGGIYDPGNPYTPEPTPPDYKDVLPPQEGVLPPIEGDPELIPGNPSIIANRLNILMENENKSILDLAKDFKKKYPDDKYKVIYYDDVIKRMQIEVPKEEREQLKQAIPGQFAPEYELFVFDEALFEVAYTPNDPAFSDSDKSWYMKTINAQKAWDISMGSEKVTVAIVDNGFNLKHPELSSKVVQPYNVWKHSKEIFPQKIDHGTHVAGITLAIADNGKGICGIAPKCKFMPIQVADEQGIMTTTSILDGILYALYQGADVVNVSLGSQFKGLSQISEDVQKDLIRNHFKEEERLWREIMRIAANHNSTIVVSAGNDNALAGIEALQRPELFITVSAVDKNNRSFAKANFSNYGSYATISAPGVGIYSTVGGNDYQTMDGTSMAAPMVSGAVALMKSVNPSITTKQIICILRNTGLETQGNIGKLIQVDKALEKVKSGEAIDCAVSPSTGDVQILLNWNNYNDLDLYCTDPKGETIWFKNKRSSSGGQLEIDMNVEYPDSKKPIENIYWDNGKAPSGTYNVYLIYYKKHEPGIKETPYTVKVKYGDKSDEYKGTIKKEDSPLHICTFTLGDSTNTISNPPNFQDNPEAPDDSRKNSLLRERERLQQELERVEKELRSIRNRRQQ